MSAGVQPVELALQRRLAALVDGAFGQLPAAVPALAAGSWTSPSTSRCRRRSAVTSASSSCTCRAARVVRSRRCRRFRTWAGACRIGAWAGAPAARGRAHSTSAAVRGGSEFRRQGSAAAGIRARIVATRPARYAESGLRSNTRGLGVIAASRAACSGRQLRGAHAEVALRRGLGAEHAVAPLDHVEVELEDPLLRQHRFEQHGDDRLLAPCASSSSSGDRNRFFASCWVIVEPPRDHAALLPVLLERLLDAIPVEAAVVDELRVLGGDHRALQVRARCARTGTHWYLSCAFGIARAQLRPSAAP